MNSSKKRFIDIDLVHKRSLIQLEYKKWTLLPIEKAVADLQYLIPDIDKSVKYAKEHCPSVKKHKLTRDEAAALYLYTMQITKKIRICSILKEVLRDTDDRSRVRPWSAYLKLLNSAVSKLPKVKSKVWCGVDKDVHSFTEGKKITWCSINSGTTSLSVMLSFLNEAPQKTLFEIECLTGKSISAYTCFRSIDEVIFMPGATFEVVSDLSHDYDGSHIIRLKEIEANDKDDDDEENFIKDESKKQRTSKPSIRISITQKSNKPKSEHQEFAEPDKNIHLFCGGRPCAKCHKCRDWKCSSEPPIWDWLYKYEEWDNNDWNLWRHERYKFFIKRDGGTCNCYFLALYLNYGHDKHNTGGGSDYRHVCLCERH